MPKEDGEAFYITLYYYSIVWYINTLENQWQRQILKESKGETSYLQRSKDKNFIEPILRNYVRREWSETVQLLREKNPSDPVLCTLQDPPSKEREK